MALTIAKQGDYFLLEDNVLPGVPKAGYTPVIGNLVITDATLDNCYDLAANTEEPDGIVVTLNANATVMGVALLVPGTTIILPNANGAQPAKGDFISADAGGMVAVGTMGINRTRIATKVGGTKLVVIALNPAGADTVTARAV